MCADAYASMMIGHGRGTACNAFGLGLGVELDGGKAVSTDVCGVQDGVQLQGWV